LIPNTAPINSRCGILIDFSGAILFFDVTNQTDKHKYLILLHRRLLENACSVTDFASSLICKHLGIVTPENIKNLANHFVTFADSSWDNLSSDLIHISTLPALIS